MRQSPCPNGTTAVCTDSAFPCCDDQNPICCPDGVTCCSSTSLCVQTTNGTICCPTNEIACPEGCCQGGTTCCGQYCCPLAGYGCKAGSSGALNCEAIQPSSTSLPAVLSRSSEVAMPPSARAGQTGQDTSNISSTTIGAAVGVPVGIVALAAFLSLGICLKRRQERLAEQNQNAAEIQARTAASQAQTVPASQAQTVAESQAPQHSRSTVTPLLDFLQRYNRLSGDTDQPPVTVPPWGNPVQRAPTYYRSPPSATPPPPRFEELGAGGLQLQLGDEKKAPRED